MAVKQIIKQLVASSAYYSGMLRAVAYGKRAQQARSAPLILLYHRVVDPADPDANAAQPGLSVTPDTFNRQMAFLADNYQPMSLGRVVEMLTNEQEIPRRTVVVTFDDGWLDNYRQALPILRNHRVPATVFISTDFIETGRLFWFVRATRLHATGSITRDSLSKAIESVDVEDGSKLPAISSDHVADLDCFCELLKGMEGNTIEGVLDALSDQLAASVDIESAPRLTLDWNEVREMSSDLVEIGSHGCGHHILSLLSADRLHAELHESKKVIETRIGSDVRLFSYPNGDFSDAVCSAVEAAGYCGAVTVNQVSYNSPPSRFALPRINVNEGLAAGYNGTFSPSLFAAHLTRVF
ncbi:MAG: polysaccharide deacetylase family protein [Candidatus Zixiibacteriota bacterium]